MHARIPRCMYDAGLRALGVAAASPMRASHGARAMQACAHWALQLRAAPLPRALQAPLCVACGHDDNARPATGAAGAWGTLGDFALMLHQQSLNT